MIEKLVINATSETPLITLDGETGVFSISGKSYPENVNDFYKPVFDYFEAHKGNFTSNKIVLEFRWIYYNTATSKIIVKLIMKIKELNSNFSIKWICQQDDELIIEKGEEIKEVLDTNIDIIIV